MQGPQAEIGADCVIVLGIRQYAGVLFLVIIRFSLAEKSCGVFAREKWRQRKRGAVGRLAPVNATRNVGRYLCPQKPYVLLLSEGKYSIYKAQKNLLGDKYAASSIYSRCVEAEAYAKGGNPVYKYFIKA